MSLQLIKLMVSDAVNPNTLSLIYWEINNLSIEYLQI